MIDPRSIRAVAVIGNYGNRNLGDEATLAGLLQQLHLRCPDASVYCLSVDPEDTRIRHNVLAFPLFRHAGESSSSPGQSAHSNSVPTAKKPISPLQERILHLLKASYYMSFILRGARNVLAIPGRLLGELGFLMSSFKFLRGIDVLIIGGGGQLTDQFGGIWGFPYLHFKWYLLAKTTKTRLIILNVGAGPLDSPISRFLVKTIISHADFRSFRDHGSIQVIQAIGVRGANHLYPDLAYALPIQMSSPPVRSLHGERIVGINPFPYYDARYLPPGNQTLYHAYLRTLSAFISWLLRNNYNVILFPTQLRADTRVIHDLTDLLPQTRQSPNDSRIRCPSISTVDDLISCISSTDLVVATRFHGILLSFLVGKPVLALSNHPKMNSIMATMGQPEHLLSLKEITLDVLISAFINLQAHADRIRPNIQERTHECRLAVEKQFDLLLGSRHQPPIPVTPVSSKESIQNNFPLDLSHRFSEVQAPGPGESLPNLIPQIFELIQFDQRPDSATRGRLRAEED